MIFFYKTVTVWRKNYFVSVSYSTIFVKLEVLCDLIKQLGGLILNPLLLYSFNPLVIRPNSLLKRQLTRENLSVETMRSNVDIST